MSVTVEQVYDALRPVKDPEVDASIVDLGLIRDVLVDEDGKRVTVYMTLTSPMCPMGPQIIEAARTGVLRLDDVDRVDIKLVWTPPWDPRRDASDDIKAAFGIWD